AKLQVSSLLPFLSWVILIQDKSSTYNELCDPKDPKYLNKNQWEVSWRQISAQINMPVKAVTNKTVSFCGSYRREKSREKKSRLTGSGAAHVYNSK
ncbi:hypothetical protein HF086_015209, partial [Spodoptera exigua]